MKFSDHFPIKQETTSKKQQCKLLSELKNKFEASYTKLAFEEMASCQTAFIHMFIYNLRKNLRVKFEWSKLVNNIN